MKILEIDKNEALKRLRDLGAKKIFKAFMHVRYFDYPDHRIHKKGDLLRVRQFKFKNKSGCPIKVEAVYKIKRGIKRGCKVFDELEFSMEHKKAFEFLSQYLKKLGLKQTLYYEKKRTLFAYKNLKFELDEHSNIPPFLEIEAHSAEEIHRALKALGLEKYEKSPETIEALMKRKYRKKLTVFA